MWRDGVPRSRRLRALHRFRPAASARRVGSIAARRPEAAAHDWIDLPQTLTFKLADDLPPKLLGL
jgi:hypothetical protein